MANKHTEYPGVDFLVLDARDMSVFPDGSFTLVFDKGIRQFAARLGNNFCMINFF